MRDFNRTRFDDDARPTEIGSLPNLMDLMLVFAVGLIAALASVSGSPAVRQNVEMGAEIPELPGAADASGDGLEAVGRVFRDPESGRLFLIK